MNTNTKSNKMRNVPFYSSQKLSKPDDEATTPHRPTLPVDYSQNQPTTDIPNQTTQPLRKKSSILESDAESYHDPQGVRTRIQNNLPDSHLDYTDNLADNIFRHDFVN